MKRSRNGSGKGGGVAGFGVAPHCMVVAPHCMVVVEQWAVGGPPCITGQAGCPLSPLEVVLFFFFCFLFRFTGGGSIRSSRKRYLNDSLSWRLYLFFLSLL